MADSILWNLSAIITSYYFIHYHILHYHTYFWYFFHQLVGKCRASPLTIHAIKKKFYMRRSKMAEYINAALASSRDHIKITTIL